MTIDEEMAARGRLVTEYSDANRHLSTLLAEATRIGELYSKLGKTLKDSRSLFGQQHEVKLDADTEAAIDVDKVRLLLKDLHETHSRLEGLRAQVEPFGLR